ncbi:MAG: hypothetical protein R3F33_12085 [Planctomycetota bacterium]
MTGSTLTLDRAGGVFGRGLVTLFMAWLGIGALLHPDQGNLFSAINLGIHELGHVVLSPLGLFLHVIGGTLFQLAAPIAAVVMFLRQGDAHAATIGGAWFSLALYEAATYVGDARARALPLVSLGSGEPIHDWHYLLGTVGWLEADGFLAGLMRVIAFLCMWGSTGLGLYVLGLRLSRG